MLGDSGGFQVIGDHLVITDQALLDVLHWLEQNCDAGMTLDVPSAAVHTPGNLYYLDFAKALATTVHGLAFFKQHRDPISLLWLLNVLQGHTRSEAYQWYDAVKPYQLEGWAWGGNMRFDLRHVLRLLLRMASEGHCVKKTRERHAVREMKEDPSEPSCRGRLQTATSCFGQKPRW